MSSAYSEKGLSRRFSDLRTGPSNGSQQRLNSAAAPPSGSPQRPNSASRGAVGNKSQSRGRYMTRQSTPCTDLMGGRGGGGGVAFTRFHSKNIENSN